MTNVDLDPRYLSDFYIDTLELVLDAVRFSVRYLFGYSMIRPSRIMERMIQKSVVAYTLFIFWLKKQAMLSQVSNIITDQYR